MKYLYLFVLALFFSFSAMAQGLLTGPANVCTGSTVQYSDSSPGGTWSNSNTAAGTVSPVNGIFTGTALSTQTTVITHTTGSSFATMTVTVSPLPATYSLTGGGAYCSGGAGVPIGLSGSDAGIHYQLYMGASAIGTPVTGTGSSISFGTIPAAGSYSVLATDSAAGCASHMSGGATVTVNTLPGLYTISGGGVYCSTAPPGVVYCLCASAAGSIIYQLYGPGGVAVGPPIVSTGGGINFDSISASGTYSVLATDPTTGCTAWMHDSVVVVINPALAPITGVTSLCGGFTTQLSDATPGGVWSCATSVVATVTSSGLVTGGTIIASPEQTTVTYSVSTGYGCVATTTITVNPQPATITGTTSFCNGSSVTLSDSSPGGIWSASNSGVSVGSLSGIVTGTAPAGSSGTSLITYSLGTCYATQLVSINAQPHPISAPASICAGAYAALSEGSPGGTWSSSYPTVAAINPLAAIVYGASAGVTNISYFLPSGCYTTTSLTVNTSPAPPTSTYVPLCVGSFVILSDATPGGTWSSGNFIVAPVLGTDTLKGYATGSTLFYYNLPNGCSSSGTVTVVAAPANISGPSSVCDGSTAILSDATPGGTWSSGNSIIATINSSTGLAVGIVAGLTPITYTLPTGCFVSVPLYVNPLPPPIIGSSNICANAFTTFSDTTPGGTWSSDNFVVATIDPISGIAYGPSAGICLISYTLPTGCFTTSSLTVNPVPNPITGNFFVCSATAATLSDMSPGGIW